MSSASNPTSSRNVDGNRRNSTPNGGSSSSSLNIGRDGHQLRRDGYHGHRRDDQRRDDHQRRRHDQPRDNHQGRRHDGPGNKIESRPSFGVLPFVEVAGKWYCLMQISFSSTKLDFKVDPIRGRQEGQEEPFSTAAREVYEETKGVLAFGEALKGLPTEDGFFCVRIPGTELPALATASYDQNEEWPGIQPETVGIVWMECDEDQGLSPPPSCPHSASQTLGLAARIRSKPPGYFASLPPIALTRRVAPDGRVSFVGGGGGGHGGVGAPNGGVEAQNDGGVGAPNGTGWRISEFAGENFDNFDSETLWEMRRNKLAKYPGDRPAVIETLEKAYMNSSYSRALSRTYPAANLWDERVGDQLGRPNIPTADPPCPKTPVLQPVLDRRHRRSEPPGRGPAPGQ